MANPAATKLTHEQLKKVLTPTPGGRKDEYICPVCERGHLLLFGDNGFDCKNDCDDSAVAKKLRELVGSGQRHAPKTLPKPKGAEAEPTGLTLEEYCELKKLPLRWLVLHYGDFTKPHPMQASYDGKPVVTFAYMDADRNTLFTRFRFGNSKPRSEYGSKMTIPYGVWLPRNKADAKGNWPRSVILCEGESDQQTLYLHGFAALGIPGANNWKPEWAQLPVLKYANKVFIIQEPGDAGKKFVETISRDLGAKAVPLKLKVKDPSELHLDLIVRREFGEPTTFGDELVAASKLVIDEDPDGEGIEILSAEDVQAKVHRWLWEDRIPLDKHTLFVGLPDQGKSTVAIAVAACVSTGRSFPDRSNLLPPSDVLMLIAEDDLEDTVKPRLMAAEADMSRIGFVQGTVKKGDETQERHLALNRDLAKLERKLQRRPNTKLIIIDPISSYLGDDVSPNKSEEVRPLLEQIKAMAKRAGVTFLSLAHFNKNADQESIHRIAGAGAWNEVPRAIWGFIPKEVEDGEEPTSLMLRVKLNTAKKNVAGLQYRTVDTTVQVSDGEAHAPRVQWLGDAEENFRDAMNASRTPKTGPKPVKLDGAMNWLKDYLADGPRTKSDVLRDGKEADHAEDTLYRAKEKLGVVSSRNGNSGPYFWRLPG